MTYLYHALFDKLKNQRKHPAFKDKSGNSEKVVIVRRRLTETLYAQQYSADFGVYCDIVDPIVRSTKTLVLKKYGKKFSIKSELSTLIEFFFI